ncbi:MAG: pyridoxal phosphate-dependent aminotransferase [Candidatus Fimisoma sp.]
MTFKQADRLKGIPMSRTRVMLRKCQELRAAGEKVTALTLGEPDFDTPEYIIMACKKALDDGLTKYTDSTGPLELREAICRKLKRENGLVYCPEEISVTSGVEQGTFAAFMSFLNPGDEVLVQDPVYLTYTTIPEIAGATVKTYSLLEENDFQPDMNQLRSLVTDKTKMIAMVSPGNPTGSIFTRESLEAIAELAREKNLLVVSDEIYERLTYGEKDEVVSIASLPGMKERTILLNGLSKSMAMTGWRIGYMAAPPELIDPLNRMAFYMTAGATSFAQYAAVEALDGDDGSAEKMRLEFKKRRDYLAGEINKMENFSCIVPQGAFYVFMNIKKTGMKSEEFCDYALEQYRLAMMPGDVFGQCGEGFVRLSYAASRQVLEEAVCILKDIDHEISQKTV